MCGLFGGISTFLTPGEIETIQDLGTVSIVRGRFGGGVVIIPLHKKAEPRIIKTELPVTDVLFSEEFNKASKQPTVIMGHARFPTSGDCELADQHPHEIGDLLGMHNGTLTKVAGASVGKKENDSRLMFTMLQNRGVEETFKNIEGSYACSWINKADKSLNFFRNSERGLFFGCLEGSESTIYWASEREILEFVLFRNRRSLTNKVKVFQLNPETLLTFDLHNSGHLNNPRVKKIEIDKKRLDNTNNSRGHLPENKHPVSSLNTTTRYSTFGAYSTDLYTLLNMLDEGCRECLKKANMGDYHQKKIKFISQTAFECTACQIKDDLNDNLPMLM